MHFSTLAVLFSLAASSIALPAKRTVGSAAPVLTAQSFSQFTVSSGQAGNALAEVNAKFPINLNDLAQVAASDLQIITQAAKISEQAEIGIGGFNEAIAAAGGKNTIAGKALQNGKIKNKVLKLQTDVLRIQIEVAQGNANSAGNLATQQTKLATNVALDVAASGQTSTTVNFVGTD